MYYGFDIGGTKIELAVFDAGLQRIWQKRIPTPRDDYEHLLNDLMALTREADARSGCQGTVGVGVPGMENADDGTLFAANLPAAMGRPLRADLSRRLQRDVRLSNDANCFALSEAWDNEFRAYPVVLGIILGTGMGGGLVVNGRVVDGKNGVAGELGHFRLPVDALDILGASIPRVPCGCGRAGCVENYLSGRGFEWLYAHFHHRMLSAPEIIRAFYAGDPQARAHVDRYLALLAVCLGNLLTLIDPHLVVFGGGLSNFDEIYRQLPQRLPDSVLPVARVPRIEKARHGDAGGVRGAALLHLMSPSLPS
ncbi:N-acetylglucosamine kinase [Dickeya oryzae]|uniref:N-acetyl-D-glucosamine kinase n=1 Tax=Dickeya oryzae TaxID=1240404 RepID=A0AB39II36_9GAMM|nr:MULTISPECIES: N-acetylglucosamine kinase [Dickeya]MBP2856706.1 N-acetylglucosamine kinase [Dickeya oryzae]MCA6990636.1 N-acetylglucosamine kinase [Dickeya oryzae]MCO7261349.1 N-acetylglucosamine kinase [Dickeya zeae]